LNYKSAALPAELCRRFISANRLVANSEGEECIHDFHRPAEANFAGKYSRRPLQFPKGRIICDLGLRSPSFQFGVRSVGAPACTQPQASDNAVQQDRSSQDSLGNEQGEGRKKDEIGKGSALIA
jgi:hypothetical protein